MMDEYSSKKHGMGKKYGQYGKKNLKSKFASGFRNIFHTPKTLRHSASMPSGLNISGPIETLSIYPIHKSSPDNDTQYMDGEKQTVQKRIPRTARMESRPVSACFSSPIGLNNGGVPMDNNNFLPLTANQNVHGNMYNYHKGDTLRLGHAIRQEEDTVHIVSKTDSVYDNQRTNAIGLVGKIVDVDANNNVKKVPKSNKKVLRRTSSEQFLSLQRLDETDNSLVSQQLATKNKHLSKRDEATNKKTRKESPRLTNDTNIDRRKKLGYSTPTLSRTSGVPLGTNDKKNVTSQHDWKVRSPTSPNISSSPQISMQRATSDSTEIANTCTENTRITRNDKDAQIGSKKRPVSVSRSLSHSGDLRLTSRRDSPDVTNKVCVPDNCTIETVIHDVLQLLLVDKRYDAKFVTKWCKDICVKVRDRLLRANALHHKVVVNAHIASKVRDGKVLDTIHVVTQCEAHASHDRFVTVALEGEDLYVWVTVLLLRY